MNIVLVFVIEGFPLYAVQAAGCLAEFFLGKLDVPFSCVLVSSSGDDPLLSCFRSLIGFSFRELFWFVSLEELWVRFIDGLCDRDVVQSTGCVGELIFGQFDIAFV